MASPTRAIDWTPSSSTRRQTSAASSVRDSGRMIVAPEFNIMNAAHCAAPCMSGGSASSRNPALLRARSAIWSYEVISTQVPTSLPPMAFMKMSSERHSTPLGIPVVPPV